MAAASLGFSSCTSFAAGGDAAFVAELTVVGEEGEEGRVCCSAEGEFWEGGEGDGDMLSTLITWEESDRLRISHSLLGKKERRREVFSVRSLE